MTTSRTVPASLAACSAMLAVAPLMAQSDEHAAVFTKVRAHDFHPTRGGFTADRDLGKPGVASLDDID